jgi:hypothetical protein
LREERQVGIYRLTVVSGPNRDLELSREDEVWFRLFPSDGRYAVEAPPNGRRLYLNSTGLGWQLVTEENPDVERVCWSPVPGVRSGIAGSSLLYEDGSLYLISDRPGKTPGYELCVWQTDWPFFTASIEEGAWTVQVHPSGATLIEEGRGIDLLILFTAAISGIRSGFESFGEEIS